MIFIQIFSQIMLDDRSFEGKIGCLSSNAKSWTRSVSIPCWKYCWTKFSEHLIITKYTFFWKSQFKECKNQWFLNNFDVISYVRKPYVKIMGFWILLYLHSGTFTIFQLMTDTPKLKVTRRIHQLKWKLRLLQGVSVRLSDLVFHCFLV